MNGFQAIAAGFALSAFALVAACAPSQKTETPIASTQEKAAPVKSGWEPGWEKAITEARKESKVIVYSTSGPEVRIPVGNAFRERFGIPVEFVTGKGAEVSAKILSERKAGIFLADVYVGGATTLVNSLKPAGLLDPIEPLLVLPEVTGSQY